MSPAKPFHGLIWGLGPSFSFATASDRSLGSGKDSAGLSTALLTIQGPWLVGVLITDVASIGGQEARKSVHQFLMQPFVDYNFSHGWYLASSPIMTADWKAASGKKWTVLVGGGGGKILHIGRQAVNAYVQAFDDVVRPHDGGTWTLRLQVQLLFRDSYINPKRGLWIGLPQLRDEDLSTRGGKYRRPARTSLSERVRRHAARFFCSSHAAGPIRIGLAAALALLERLSRHRILG